MNPTHITTQHTATPALATAAKATTSTATTKSNHSMKTVQFFIVDQRCLYTISEVRPETPVLNLLLLRIKILSIETMFFTSAESQFTVSWRSRRGCLKAGVNKKYKV
jgi:hypothetical protein